MTEKYTVTEISVQKKRRNRYSIFLNEQFAFGLHQDTLLKSGIAKGDELDDAQIDGILQMEERFCIKEKAIRLLAVRARSRKELEDRLCGAGYDKSNVADIIDYLENKQYIDDGEFAVMFACSRMTSKPCGTLLLRRELQQKGLSEENIERGLEAAYKNTTEFQIARQVADKRRERIGSVDDKKAKKRISDLLLRRGFPWHVVEEVLDHWQE
ncbi:RecX family transcriptional regulator [candidate division KSB1 bacterium]|nr:RecX family transcriptional regulator [candidate division KSB1 bacterium]